MKSRLPAILLASLATPVASAETLLLSDNFNVADTTNFDGAPLTGRLTGSLAPNVFLRSALTQHHIAGNQFRFAGGGRTRFQNSGGWFNWASGTAGTSILADGGVRISFDWTPVNATGTNWVSFDVGFPGAGEPATRVNHLETDYGILFRNNGGTERFDNGVNKGPGGTFANVLTTRHVVIDYAFSDFNDETSVKVRASVNGTVVTTSTVEGVVRPYELFTWANNSGGLFMELGTNEAGHLIDNYSVSTVPVEYSVQLANSSFISGINAGDLVTTLIGTTFAKGDEASTFTFVSGDGDTDNGKFQIDGDRIERGAYDFTADPNGTTYNIRVQGTGSVTGGTTVVALTLTLINDDDADGIVDDWELEFASNLTDLNGLATGPGPGAGSGDFDNDGISDLEEYEYSLGQFPDINPVSDDTDGDTLKDNEEIAGAGLRPPTNPTLTDTDKDGLSDLVETSLTAYTSPSDTGSNPIDPDTDLDGARDGFEVAQGTDPCVASSRPGLPTGFAVVRVTDDLSTGIDSSKYYTHKISGGGATTINDVELQGMTMGNFPPNFNWTISAGNPGAIAPQNNGDWNPVAGEVTGVGLLTMLGGFTFAANGDPGVVQTYTLSGLIPGESYQLKIFIRKWDTESVGRPNDLTFINGSTEVTPFQGLLEDRPGTVLQTGNDDHAFYLVYNYVAETNQLVIEASPHVSSIPASGSFHLYGLTNEGLSGAPPVLAVTAVTRQGSGAVLIDFIGAPETEYQVTKSTNLSDGFVPLVPPLSVTTDAAGVGQVTVPAAETTDTREFYRMED